MKREREGEITEAKVKAAKATMPDSNLANRSVTKKQYEVLVGASFIGQKGQPERRINVGDVVDDLPERVIEHLLKKKAIKEV